MLEITLVRSVIGSQQRQKDTVKALGLKRRGQMVVRPDNEAIRGMVSSVRHLVSVSKATTRD
jgi:large subunit ribosomal protein L30